MLQEIAQMKAKKLGVNEMHQKEVIQNQVRELEVFLEGMLNFYRINLRKREKSTGEKAPKWQVFLKNRLCKASMLT